MANYRHPMFDAIWDKLVDQWHPKAIASFLDVPYNTVTTIKQRFFETVYIPKQRHPDRNQGSFFNNFWGES